MRPFWFQRILRWRFVAVFVFCGPILLSPQPSEAVVRDGEYGTFYDHYGENLERLAPGDILEKESIKSLLLIVDKTRYFQMHTGKITADQRDITANLYYYPYKWQSMRRLKKVGRVPYFYATFALVDKFTRSYLPFHWNYCTKHDYMNYILYGRVKESPKDFKECPLAAPWGGIVTEQEIRSGDFKLKNFYGIEQDFSEYSDPRQGAESSTRAGSLRQLEDSDSALHRASSLERMLKSPFRRVMSKSRKRERSV